MYSSEAARENPAGLPNYVCSPDDSPPLPRSLLARGVRLARRGPPCRGCLMPACGCLGLHSNLCRNLCRDLCRNLDGNLYGIYNGDMYRIYMGPYRVPWAQWGPMGSLGPMGPTRSQGAHGICRWKWASLFCLISSFSKFKSFPFSYSEARITYFQVDVTCKPTDQSKYTFCTFTSS